MSSTFNVADSSNDREVPMILIVNKDGTVTVDADTLGKLIANQYDGNVNIVRVDGEGGGSDGTADASEVNLTIEGYGVGLDHVTADSTITIPANSETAETPGADGGDVVEIDPFSHMDPEQLERLENALQSEKAKEILGSNLEENLLEMLEGSDSNTRAEDSVHNDHSYTTPLGSPLKAAAASKAAISKVKIAAPQPNQQVTSSGVPATPPGATKATIVRTGAQVARSGRVQRGRGGRMPVSGSSIVATAAKMGNTVILCPKPSATPGNTVAIPKGRGGAQRIIMKKGTKLVAAEAVTPTNGVISKTPKILQRRVVVPKPANTIAAKIVSSTTPPTPQDATVAAAQSLVDMGNKIIVQKAAGLPNALTEIKASVSPAPVKKETPPATNRGGRRGRVNRTSISESTVAGSIPVKSAGDEDEMAAALEALEVAKSPPPGMPKVVLSTKTSPPKKDSAKLKTSAANVTPGKIKSPDGKMDIDEHRKKKDRSKSVGSASSAPLSVPLGPELFSTPDIIRRVSVDKKAANPSPDTDSLTVEEKLERIDDSGSYPTSTPIISIPKRDDQGTESLLDSLTDEVKEDTGTLLTDALFLDEITSHVLSEDTKEITNIVSNVVKDVTETPKAAKIPASEAVPSSAKKAGNLAVQSKAKSPATPKILVGKMPVAKFVKSSPTTESLKKKVATKNASATRLEIRKVKSPHLNKKITVVIKEKKPVVIPTTKQVAAEKKRTSTRKRVLTEKAAAFMSSLIDRQEDDDDRIALAAVAGAGPEGEVVSDVESPVLNTEPPEEEEEVMEEEEEDQPPEDSDIDSWNSEDDPERLWCICRKPHNNRFMIACDKCEDWFHGKCVGISKVLGKKMEEDGVEWTCPNCQKDKTKVAKTPPASQAPIAPTTVKAKTPTEQSKLGSLSCVNCGKPAKTNSSYCSDPCIKKHVLQRLLSIKKETNQLQTQSRVVVLERRSGKLLTGDSAPTADGLLNWLLAHPTYEVVEPSALPNYIKIDTPKAPQPKKQMSNLKQTVITTKQTPSGTKQMGFAQKGAVTVKSPPATSTPKAASVKGDQNTIKGQVKIDEMTIPAKSTPKVTESAESKTPARKDSSEKKPVKSVSSTPVTAEKKGTPKPSSVNQVIDKKKRRDSESSVKSATSTTPVVKEQERPSPVAAQEPIRANVKRTLQQLLSQRIKDNDDYKNVTTDEIKELVAAIEEELFKVFKDTGAKYKSKYRSLVFNIKDPKNLTLFKKIVSKSVAPAELVRLSPEELASQELAQWRQQEAKHSIEIIKKSELDLIHQGNAVLLKSRKGEEVIESKPLEKSISELESALNRTADDMEEDYQAKKDMDAKIDDEELLKLQEKLKMKDKEERSSRERRKDKKKHRSRSKDRSRSRRHRSRSRSHHRSSYRSSRSKRSHSREKKDKKKEKKEDKEIKVEVNKGGDRIDEREDNISDDAMEDSEFDIPALPIKEESLKEESDVEPTSTVTIATPPYPPDDEKPWVWCGILNMVDVTKLYSKAYHVSGPCDNLSIELTEHLECVGRIAPDSVWDYVLRMKKSGTHEIVVIKFSADSAEEKMNYLSLYSYLNSRNRMAVIGNVSRTVKDFYVFPLAGHAPIPQILLPLDGPGFEDYRPHLLLGIIVRARKVKPAPVPVRSSSVGESLGISHSPERSYTPPLPSDIRGSTPPLPKSHRGITPQPDDDDPYEPPDESPYEPEDDSLSSSAYPVTPAANDIQKNLDEVQRMIEEKKQKIETLSAIEAQQFKSAYGVVSNEDPNYSPGSYTPPRPSESGIPFLDSKSSISGINIPSDLHQILASIKSPERSQSPASIDISSDPIVKQYASSSGYLDDDLDDEFNRSRRDPRKRNDSVSLSADDLIDSAESTTSPSNISSSTMEVSSTPASSLQSTLAASSSLQSMTEEQLIKKAAEMGYPMQDEYIPSQPVTLVPGYYPPLPPTNKPPPPYVAPTPPLPPPPAYHPPPPPPPPIAQHQTPPPPTHKFDKDLRGKRKIDTMPASPEKYDKRRNSRGGGTWESGVALRGAQAPLRIMRSGNGGGGRGGHRNNLPQRGGFRPNIGTNYPPPPSGQPVTPGPVAGPHSQQRGFSRYNESGRYYGNRGKYDGIQSEWDEEIRNFEQRKSKEAAERRKRRVSRSPSPKKSRSRRSPPVR